MDTNDTITRIRKSALTLLTRRDHARREIQQKLQSKGFSHQDIAPVLDELNQAGWLNEARCAEQFIYTRRQKGYGPERIYRELAARGIAEETIAEHLQITDNAWLMEVRRVWQKHFKGAIPKTINDRAKQIRFLQYRGFTREQINSIYGSDEHHDKETDDIN